MSGEVIPLEFQIIPGDINQQQYRWEGNRSGKTRW